MHQCVTVIKNNPMPEYAVEKNHNISQMGNEQVSGMGEAFCAAGKNYRVASEFSKEGDSDALWEVRDFLIRKEMKKKIGSVQREASAVQSLSQKEKCEMEDCK